MPRDCPGYADVKRDLLREPLFGVEYDRMLPELNLGKKIAEEIVDKTARQREQKQLSCSPKDLGEMGDKRSKIAERVK